MLISGFHAVTARLRQSPGSIRELYVVQGREDTRVRDLLQAAERAGVEPRRVDAVRIDRMCPGQRHQGVVAITEAVTPNLTLEGLLDRIEGPPLLLMLDGVTDPRNLGACLRVADGAGVHGVIAPKDHACPLNETAIQTSSGAAETVPYFMVVNLARTLGELKERQIRIIGTSDDAPRSLYEVDLRGPVALVLGAEGPGMRQLTRKTCDELVHIPMAGAVESLNVSVASAVCLYEALRQRRSITS